MTTVRRDAVITLLLAIAGILLAICLFAAGMLWTAKPSRKEARTTSVALFCADLNKEEKCGNLQIAKWWFIR